MNKAEYLKLLPEFKKRFFHNFGRDKIAYGIQRKHNDTGEVGYDRNNNGTITDSLLLSHFSQRPVPGRYYTYGSLAVLGNWSTTKWICIDADTEKQISDTHKKILPSLASYGITPIIEPSREGRLHIWILTEINYETAEKFILQMFAENELAFREWEVYPLFERRKAIIRMPGGYHFKSNKANGVLVNGIEKTDPCTILKVFNEAPIYDEEFFKSKIKTVEIASRSRLQSKVSKKPFSFLSRNLPDPMEDLPRFVSKITRDCQAYRKLIFDVANNDLIEERGILHHNSGLCLSALSSTHEYVIKDGKGLEWFEKIKAVYRSRDAKEHNWDQKPGMKVWHCKTMEDNFGLCEGCPFRGLIQNPRQLFFGKEITRVKVADVIS